MTEPSKPKPGAPVANNDTERVLLRFAAIAIDVRGMLSPLEVSKVSALDRALLAIDALFRDGRQEVQPSHSEIDPPP
ncbi:MAG TPA: hypothetical protein VG986_07025 [Pseudolabrys sp.]|nr:hypothetical protein [Pseudolabrys sp.]